MAKIQRGGAKPEQPAAPSLFPDTHTVYDQDNDSGYRAPRGKKRAGWGYNLAMLFFAVVFLVSAGLLAWRFYQDHRASNDFSDLQALITEPVGSAAPGTQETADNTAKFAKLLAENPDFVGWISIDGTNLNFPVMFRPDSPEYYLRRDFKGEYSNYGVPYVDEKCTLNPPSHNLVIYGHNMKTGTIFGCLTNYKKADYYTQHPEIRFDTIYGDGTYQVFAAFAIDVVQDTSFAYNTYIAISEQQFDQYVAECKRRSDVDTGITPTYGEDLITLSTCEYSTDNGRYVVCARKVK